MKENASGGDDVGNPVTAVDDDTLTYTLDDPTGITGHATKFTIDRATGQISVKAGSEFDFNADFEASTDVPVVGPLHVEVKATDPTGAMDTVRVIITITDVNEKPALGDEVTTENSEAGLTSISLDEGGTDGALVASGNTGSTYTATDSDRPHDDPEDTTSARNPETLTWSTRGPDAGKFELSAETGGEHRAFLRERSRLRGQGRRRQEQQVRGDGGCH